MWKTLWILISWLLHLDLHCLSQFSKDFISVFKSNIHVYCLSTVGTKQSSLCIICSSDTSKTFFGQVP